MVSDDRTLYSAAKDVHLDLLRELALLTTKPFYLRVQRRRDVLTDVERVVSLAAAVAPVDSVSGRQMELKLLEFDGEPSMELLKSIGQRRPV